MKLSRKEQIQTPSLVENVVENDYDPKDEYMMDDDVNYDDFNNDELMDAFVDETVDEAFENVLPEDYAYLNKCEDFDYHQSDIGFEIDEEYLSHIHCDKGGSNLNNLLFRVKQINESNNNALVEVEQAVIEAAQKFNATTANVNVDPDSIMFVTNQLLEEGFKVASQGNLLIISW